MHRRLIALVSAIVMLAGLSAAQPAHAVDSPYDAPLLRLAEILGSLHFLRTLCGEEGGTWRGQMEALIASEEPEPERRAILVANFNRGYRSFDGVYKTCTESAIASISRYMKEGETLSRDLAVRFGN